MTDTANEKVVSLDAFRSRSEGEEPASEHDTPDESKSMQVLRAAMREHQAKKDKARADREKHNKQVERNYRLKKPRRPKK